MPILHQRVTDTPSSAVPVDDEAGLLASRAARRGLAAIIVGALCIAFSPILVRVSELPPTATGFYRTFLALPLLMLWAMIDRRVDSAAKGSAAIRERPPWRLVTVAGLAFAADLASWHWSLAYTTVANSTFIANLAPVFVTVLAWLLFRERVTRLFLVGMLVSISGAGLMVRSGLSLTSTQLLGDGLALATSLFYASYILAVKDLRRRLSTVRLMLYTSAVTSAALLVLSLLDGESLLPSSLRGFLLLLALAWISQVLGQGLIAYGLAHVPASLSSVSLLLQPPAALVLAWILLGERVGVVQGLGGVAVLIGIMVARAGSRAS